MTLDEAIKMYTSNAEYERTHGNLQGCMDFKQLAEWLKDYKRLLEQEPKTGHWIYKKRMIGTGGKYYTGEDENGEAHTIHVFERSCCDVGYCSECGKRQGDTSDRYCCYCGSYNGDDKQLREQEPCDDAISRQAYIERYRKWAYSEYGRKIDNEALAIRVAMSLPPATSQPKSETVTEFADRCRECGSKYGKLLRQDRETGHWIPVSERLPEDLEPVNITWVNHNPESYYADIKDKPFTATGVYFNGQWYWWSTLCTDMLAEYSHNYDDIIDDDVEITAWTPLPKPYEPQESEG